LDGSWTVVVENRVECSSVAAGGFVVVLMEGQLVVELKAQVLD